METSQTPVWVEPLRQANEIRLKRAELKRQLRAGKVPFDQILFSPPEWLEDAPIGEMMRALRGIGRTKVGKALAYTHLSWTRTFAGTPLAQRKRLDDYMRERHPSYYPTRR